MSIPCHITLALIITWLCPFLRLKKKKDLIAMNKVLILCTCYLMKQTTMFCSIKTCKRATELIWYYET